MELKDVAFHVRHHYTCCEMKTLGSQRQHPILIKNYWIYTTPFTFLTFPRFVCIVHLRYKDFVRHFETIEEIAREFLIQKKATIEGWFRQINNKPQL